MRALPLGFNRKPYIIYRVLKPIDNVAASKIMSLFGEIGLGTQYELPKSVKSYRIWASGRGENRKMLKINELNSYLKSKGVPEDSYSINEVNDESLCIVEENKKMSYILFWKRIENRRILLPRWTFGNSIFYKSVIKNVKFFFRMKKSKP